MAMMGATSAGPRKMSILPEGGRDFLRRRMMELV
jgi:S-DNA-T family DNA segregation ATPase FtsK/SpoIIIE